MLGMIRWSFEEASRYYFRKDFSLRIFYDELLEGRFNLLQYEVEESMFLGLPMDDVALLGGK